MNWTKEMPLFPFVNADCETTVYASHFHPLISYSELLCEVALFLSEISTTHNMVFYNQYPDGGAFNN